MNIDCQVPANSNLIFRRCLFIPIREDDLKNDFYVGHNNKIETPQQHFYYQCYISMGFNVDLSAKKVREYVLHLKQKCTNEYLQKKQENPTIKIKNEFPYKDVVSVTTIKKWRNNFDWDKRRAEEYYNSSANVKDKINEYNNEMILEDMKQNVSLNKALTALQNILTKLIIHLNPDEKETVDILARIGSLYNLLTRLKMDKTIHINKIGEYITSWLDVKEQISLHHNELNSEEEYLQMQFDVIDYYFEEYADE